MKGARQKEILELLLKENTLSTEALAEYFDVSTQTIRRDLDSLEAQGFVTKMYGGASLIQSAAAGISMVGRGSSSQGDPHLGAKRRIAAEAIKHVQDGTVIAVDMGSTTQIFAELLNQKNNLLVLTYDLGVAAKLVGHPTNKLYVFGGYVDASGATSGAFARDTFKTIAGIDAVFFSSDGITLEDGLTSNRTSMDNFRRTGIELAAKRIAMVDSSKFGNTFLYKIGDLDEVHTLITDKGIKDEYLNALEKTDINLKIV